MTTLCLCDWVETRADRERRLATVDPAALASIDLIAPVAVRDAAAVAAQVPATATDIRLKQEYAT
jgi:hypothetical protein